MQLTEHALLAWDKFLNNRDNHGHAQRVLHGADIEAHVQACWNASCTTAKRIKADLPNLKPKRILEIGSSTGLNCFALQKEYPCAEVIGIEPEYQAIDAANALRCGGRLRQPSFEHGVGEDIPLADESIDLVICHTVIEHVNDVEIVVKEMARVLNCNGVIHLEAPNYRFPFEPHLGIFTIPFLGKGFVKFSALIQGKWSQRNFVNHLKFVTPGFLQQNFKKYELSWNNRAIDKLHAASNGQADIKRYHAAVKLLGKCKSFRGFSLIISAVAILGLYPSVLYTVQKQVND